MFCLPCPKGGFRFKGPVPVGASEDNYHKSTRSHPKNTTTTITTRLESGGNQIWINFGTEGGPFLIKLLM